MKTIRTSFASAFIGLVSVLTVFLICLCFHQAVSATNPQSTEINISAQEDVIMANINLNRMCHIAASFGYDAASKGLSKEQMHQELKEILK